MNKFAIVNKDTKIVENSVVGDNGSVIALMFEDKDVYQETDSTGPIYIGGDFYKNKFRPLSPFSSWIFNEEKWIWEPIKEYPIDGSVYTWNEDILDWEKINAITI